MTFLFVGILVLVLGYVFYGKFIAKNFGEDDSRPTPAIAMADGVDYIQVSSWKATLVQFLNIAGLGPIYGAVLGSLYGPAAFFWIILGGIFAGAVHDYMTGMISVRHQGHSMPEITGQYIGKKSRTLMLIFTANLLFFVGIVFVSGPAGIMANLTLDIEQGAIFKDTILANIEIWIFIIFGYYFLATVLPIDKIILKIYPFFGAVLLFMAVAIVIAMVWNGITLPPITSAWDFIHPNGTPLWPLLFFTISCGALSGFHSTQSTLMARCIKKETDGRPVFYGAMIFESIIALIWAAAAMTFFPDIKEMAAILAKGGPGLAVNIISVEYLGVFGGLLAIIGVVVCPITSGDTAFRSLRLVLSDFIKFDQKPVKNRLILAVPIFILAYFISKLGFDVIWRFFTFSNQALATIGLYTATAFLVYHKKFHWITTIPAMFMTIACATYVLFAKEFYIAFPIEQARMYGLILGVLLICFMMFVIFGKKNKDKADF